MPLTDEEWERLRRFLPADLSRGGRWADHRMVINGIFFWTRTGCQPDRAFLDRRSHPGLRIADGGSLTICMRRDEPSSPGQRASYLPAPDGNSRPILRVHEPGKAVFDGRHDPPPITKSPRRISR
jgi:hypothetical protein